MTLFVPSSLRTLSVKVFPSAGVKTIPGNLHKKSILLLTFTDIRKNGSKCHSKVVQQMSCSNSCSCAPLQT